MSEGQEEVKPKDRRLVLICAADDKALEEHSIKHRNYYKECVFRKAYTMGYSQAMDDLQEHDYEECAKFFDEALMLRWRYNTAHGGEPELPLTIRKWLEEGPEQQHGGG